MILHLLISRNEDLEQSFDDSWLEASTKRCEKSDPDYDMIKDDLLPIELAVRSSDPTKQNIYLVYESCLEKLMTHCPRCKHPIVEIKCKQVYGTQICYYFSCVSGCDERWYSQPVIAAVKGINYVTYIFVIIARLFECPLP